MSRLQVPVVQDASEVRERQSTPFHEILPALFTTKRAPFAFLSVQTSAPCTSRRFRMSDKGKVRLSRHSSNAFRCKHRRLRFSSSVQTPGASCSRRFRIFEKGKVRLSTKFFQRFSQLNRRLSHFLVSRLQRLAPRGVSECRIKAKYAFPVILPTLFTTKRAPFAFLRYNIPIVLWE